MDILDRLNNLEKLIGNTPLAARSTLLPVPPVSLTRARVMAVTIWGLHCVLRQRRVKRISCVF